MGNMIVHMLILQICLSCEILLDVCSMTRRLLFGFSFCGSPLFSVLLVLFCSFSPGCSNQLKAASLGRLDSERCSFGAAEGFRVLAAVQSFWVCCA